MVPSAPATASVPASGLSAAEITSASLVRTVVACLVARSHRRVVTSPPLATVRPSGPNATKLTGPVWPMRTTSVVRVATGWVTRVVTRPVPAAAMPSWPAGEVR
jgi:hypothetical protein